MKPTNTDVLKVLLGPRDGVGVKLFADYAIRIGVESGQLRMCMTKFFFWVKSCGEGGHWPMVLSATDRTIIQKVCRDLGIQKALLLKHGFCWPCVNTTEWDILYTGTVQLGQNLYNRPSRHKS